MPSSPLFVIRSGPGPDRNGVIVDSDAWDFSSYLRNPVVFFNHRADQPPVARCEGVWREGDVWTARFQFLGTPQAKELAEICGAHKLLGASPYGISRDFEVLRTKEGAFAGLHFHKVNVSELSIVGVPADPGALQVQAGAFLAPDGLGHRFEGGLIVPTDLEPLFEITRRLQGVLRA